MDPGGTPSAQEQAATPFPAWTLLAAVCLFAAASVSAQSYVWKNVQIKGGGFVSGIITHPNAAGVIYCRTDIGGAYRWNASRLARVTACR